MYSNRQTGKLLIFSAPSGSGKTTLIRWLLQQGLNLEFSVSATSRVARPNEKDGTDYYFLSPEAFRQRIQAGDFLEWEEVYADTFYGTLRSEVTRMFEQGHNVLLDVDVKGGLNIKKHYGDQALALFVRPPSIEQLRERLEHRGTDNATVIQERVEKAAWELSYAPQFDVVLVNDELEAAKVSCLKTVQSFLDKHESR